MDHTRRFVRPKNGRMVAGVAAAIANYFNIPVVMVRIVWVLLFIPGGLPGFLPYVILWFLIPSEESIPRVNTV